MCKKQLCYTILFVFAAVYHLKAQHSLPDTLTAYRINTEINFDGNPDETIWQSAQHINNFTQRELHFGEPASEKTEAAILYDNNNLYIGVWCYQQHPEKIVA